MLVRIANDGGLPDLIAADLRRRTMRTAGLLDGRYQYPVGPNDANRLARLLPGCIARTDNCFKPTRFPMSLTRRTDGRLRTQWSNGKLTV
jgi:hypothetical protein